MLRQSHIQASLSSLLLLGSIAGCAQGGGLGLDAGRPGFDAGPALDTGAPVDSGEGDGGAEDDAASDDASVIPGEDAGSIPDVDAGTIPGADAGTVPDAGTDAGTVPDAGTDAGPVDRCLGVSCTGLDTACRVGVCNPATGACVSEPRADGTTCSDGNACTTTDQCVAGTCTPGPAVDCSGLDGTCVRGACNPTTGTCSAQNVADGTSCDPDAGDCVSQTCAAGTCVAAPTNDCSSCTTGGGTVCAAGACGAPPTSLAYGFEGGLPATWTTGGDAPWVVDGSRVFEGSMAAHSGAIGANDTSSLTAPLTLSQPAVVSFRFNVSTEPTHDTLRVLVDGVVVDPIWSGTWGWTQSAVIVPAGAHTIEWRYSKDGSINTGSDRVWLDDVRVEPLAPSTGFEEGVLPRAFGTSPTTGWVVDTSSALGGSYAAHSGAIGNSASSVLWRWVRLEAAGTLSFAYRVSSESCCDALELWVDGSRLGAWRGEVAWTTASFPLAAGAHFVEWRYVKDGSVTGGMDRVWIDDVQTGETAPTGPLCGG